MKSCIYKLKNISFIIFFYIILMSSLQPLPPYISIEERVKESSLIIIGSISVLKERTLFEDTKMATLIVKKEKILKNTFNLNVPDTFFIYLNIYPETFENKLKFVPEEGKYIIFLEPIVKDQEIVVFKLYREEPFALQPWDQKTEEKIIFDLKNQ